MLHFCFLEQRRQHKYCIKGAALPPESKLFLTKQVILLADGGHGLGHSDSQKSQQV